MNNQELNNIEFKTGIQSLSIKFDGLLDFNDVYNKCIATKEDNIVKSTVILSNNNIKFENIESYSDYKKSLKLLLEELKVTKYHYLRCDFKLDNINCTKFDEMYKPYKFIISLFATTYCSDNKYETKNIIKQNIISNAFKNECFEIEHYDANEKYSDGINSRLVLRSVKCRKKDIQTVFTKTWDTRWSRALLNFNNVCDMYNDELERIYLENKDIYPKKFKSLTDFILQYQDCIFTKYQLIDLFKRFDEVQNPINRATDFKRKYGIQFYSRTKIGEIIGKIQSATNEFFLN